LAGGYNSNILKLAAAEMEGKNAVVLPIGKKAVDYFKNHGIPSLTDSYAEAADVSIGDCFSIAKQLSKGFLKGEYDEICLCYTNFVSVLSQTPASMGLLPLERTENTGTGAEILYEPDSSEVFARIVPEYLGGILYGALCESCCAELAARRTAMDSATQNAEEMIADLSLKFNQARQAAITNEIIDIVAGS
jgi:F-type H+-transporting ATPase subunit gamma